MGYIFLLISLLLGTTKGYCGKKMGYFSPNTMSDVLLNFARMVLCIVFGTLLIFVCKDTGYLTLNSKLLMISAFSGISTSFFVVTWLISVKKSAYMMLDVSLMLGTLVPMIFGYFLFNEKISLNQWIGFIILIGAVIIMCSYNNSIKTKLNIFSFLLLLICGFANGLTDFSQKMFVKTLPDIPVSIFNLYTYIFAAAALFVVFWVQFSNGKTAQFEENSSNKYWYIIVMSASLILNSYFKTKSALYLDSAQLYPLNQGMALILSTLMASVFFKEKMTVKCVVGIFIAFIGLLIMNVDKLGLG